MWLLLVHQRQLHTFFLSCSLFSRKNSGVYLYKGFVNDTSESERKQDEMYLCCFVHKHHQNWCTPEILHRNFKGVVCWIWKGIRVRFHHTSAIFRETRMCSASGPQDLVSFLFYGWHHVSNSSPNWRDSECESLNDHPSSFVPVLAAQMWKELQPSECTAEAEDVEEPDVDTYLIYHTVAKMLYLSRQLIKTFKKKLPL